MNWSEDPSLAAEIVDRLNKRITRYRREDTSLSGAEDQDAVMELIRDLHAIYISHTGTNDMNERFKILTALGEKWDTDEPGLAHAQKYLNRLFAGQSDDAFNYIDKAINEREQEHASVTKAVVAKSGSQGGNAKNRITNEAIKNAMSYYEQHKSEFTTKKAAARHLEKEFPPVKFSTYCRILTKS